MCTGADGVVARGARRGDALVSELSSWFGAGGPRPEEFGRVARVISELWELVGIGEVDRDAIWDLWRDLGSGYLHDTMQGFAWSKPHGYAGDFEMIDRIYTRWMSPSPTHRRWDEFFHVGAAPRAVRNRSLVLGEQLDWLAEHEPRGAVLNVGCGPCRDVASWLAVRRDSYISLTNLDADAKAIRYAKEVLAGVAGDSRIRFVEANVLRYRGDERFDLIWSAGLFDYLEDRVFVRVLRRLNEQLAAGGRIVVGNFATNNPDRGYMELIGDWHLIHRSPDDLRRLASAAGCTSCEVTSDQTGINLFLVVSND